MSVSEIEILYIGIDPIRVNLRDGRAVEFSLQSPQREIPAGSAQDLLSPAIGGGRFIHLKGGA